MEERRFKSQAVKPSSYQVKNAGMAVALIRTSFGEDSIRPGSPENYPGWFLCRGERTAWHERSDEISAGEPEQ